MRERGQTFCAFGRPWGSIDDHDWVDVDGAHGTRLAVDHLVARGHRRIGFLGWPDNAGTGADRRRGWLEALDGHGLGGGRGHRSEHACVDDADAAEQATAELLGSEQPPDALVCASDTLALGAHRAAARLATGRRTADRPHPGIVGFDATPVSAALGIPSVAQPIRAAAHACLDLLGPWLAGENPAPRGVLLAPTLHVPT